MAKLTSANTVKKSPVFSNNSLFSVLINYLKLLVRLSNTKQLFSFRYSLCLTWCFLRLAVLPWLALRFTLQITAASVESRHWVTRSLSFSLCHISSRCALRHWYLWFNMNRYFGVIRSVPWKPQSSVAHPHYGSDDFSLTTQAWYQSNDKNQV